MIHLHYIDDALLVAEKPAGLLSVPGRSAENQDCVVARLQALYPDALTVHRLDQVTSGLLLHARGKDMQAALSMQFEQRQVGKRYEAVVQGLLERDTGEVDLPLIVDWPNRPKQMVDHERGKPALTRWRVLVRDVEARRTRVALEPITGRSHQLRLHMASIGHPIVGDVLYDAAPA
ncbi:MAG: pseudouridine synthase, partial [Stenotrophomonas maltophilia]|nr:pseudouridine synthase [Stenotrophomonas maltophilia]